MSYAELLKNREKNKHKYNQDFTDSKENYSLTQYGETYNLYQFIQDNREDTEIIPTLEKYGMAKGMEKLKLYDPENAGKYYGDFREMTDMRNLMDKAKAADDLWLSLPLQVREKFGHSKHEFYEKGGEWLKTESEKAMKAAQQKAEAETALNANNLTVEQTEGK